MKKALIISNTSGLITDFLENDIKILEEKGYLIDCASNLKYSGKDTDKFITKYNLNMIDIEFPVRDLDIKLIIESIKKLKKILKENEYQVIHCHSTIAAVIGRHCAKKYRKNGTKVIYTSHGFPFFKGNNGIKSKIYKSIEKFYSKYTDAIVTICNEDFESANKFKCKKVFKIHGVGIDLTKFDNTNIDINRYKEKNNISTKDLIIFSVGELNTNKNHEAIIRAISMLDFKNKITYMIAGREVTEIGKKKYLEEIAKKLGVKVVFLGFRKDIPSLLKIADIGALPSFKEGLGLSGLEMIASGLPVIASNRQGIKDYVIEGETGFLFNPTDTNEITNAIKKAIEFKKEKREFNHDIVIKYDIQHTYKEMQKIYNSVL